MPQLRKRKTKDTISEEFEIKDRPESPAISKSIINKKKKNEVVLASKTKVKSSTKRKKNVSPEYSDDESLVAKKTASKTRTKSSKKRKNSESPEHSDDESPKKTASKTRTKSMTKRKNCESREYSDHESSKKTSSKTKTKSITKGKKSESPEYSGDELLVAKKTVIGNSSSPRKDAKFGKEVIFCVNIKDEHSDLESLRNSVDSGISSEALTDTSKEETKFDMLNKSQPSTSSSIKNEHKDDSSSSESEWEEVEDACETASLDDYKPDIPKEGVEITIDCPDLHIRKRKKKTFDENEWIRLYVNRMRKDAQLSVHKTHLLCLLAHGIYVNKILNSDSIKAFALSLIPDDISSLTSGKKVDKIDISGFEKIMLWFCDSFEYENEKCTFLNLSSSMMKSFSSRKALNASEYNLMFIVIARILGFKVRMCVSLYPVTYKASNLIKKPGSKKNSKKSTSGEAEEKKSQVKEKKEKTKVKKESTAPKASKEKKKTSVKKSEKRTDDENNGKISRPRRSTGQNYKLSSDEDNSDDKDFIMCDDGSSDEDFKKPPRVSSKSKQNSTPKVEKKQSNRKILSSDSEPSSPKSAVLEGGSVICWTEIYSKPDKQWIAIDCANNIINKPYDIEELLPKPVSYILAYDNKSYVKDVTRRYCNEYMTSTIKLRVDPEWWEETLDPFLPPNSQQDKAEEKKLDEMLVNKPLPKTVQGFKNHPLYALKRHLLKFEAIYPPDAPPVGFMRGEPVYARDCVHQLHSRETWLKEARVVRIGEQPYKIVKARPKWDRIAGVMRTDLPLEIFGHWQTEQYEPPVAVGGKVPRNEYGNVELFKPCMLPKGTVHLQLPGLNRIAKKLNIDCCAAVVGFDGHKGSVHPVFDGFIVCKEFKDTLIAAWDEEQENARKREEEKREKRIYGNWKKLIRGLLIRERIKLKYDVN